jgi:hypothetical protein
MTIEDWFALLIRVLGVAILIFGLGGVVNAFLYHLGYFTFPESSVGYYLIDGLFYSFAGLYLIRGADSLVNFAYPKNYREESEEDDDSEPEEDIK